MGSRLKAFSLTSVRCGETYKRTELISLSDSTPGSCVASRAKSTDGGDQVDTFLYSVAANKLLLTRVTQTSANSRSVAACVLTLDSSIEVLYHQRVLSLLRIALILLAPWLCLGWSPGCCVATLKSTFANIYRAPTLANF